MFVRLKSLLFNLIVYGLGDVATQLTGFLLLYFFTRLLTPDDYGVLSLLLTVELVVKIISRLGVDASFMRLYYDCPEEDHRRQLASTLFFFLLAVNAGLLAIGLSATPFIARYWFPGGGHAVPLALVLVNTCVAGFFFIPFHQLRIEKRAVEFTRLTFSRSAGTLVLRVVLVLGLHLGVLGFILADVIMTAIFVGVLFRRFSALIRPTFSRVLLRQALRFGLPRLPHGVAQQVIGPGTDAALLRAFLRTPNALAEIGLYGLGASWGLSLKLLLSAFEYAWAPFCFETMTQPDAKETFRRLTTYGLAILVLAAAGMSAIAGDLVRMVMRPGYFRAADVIPWIAIGVVLQGTYTLTSIGLVIKKRTEFYPVATVIAATVDVVANFLLIPRFGMLGPAYANMLAYAVLAALGMTFSQRLYPISYEWSRLARVVGAGLLAFAAARYALPGLMWSPLGVLARGTTVVVVYASCLLVTGFFSPGERVRLAQISDRLLARWRRGRDAAV
ncbi:MAG: lipopolysaccharide biosynthesis protein [Bacteroidales bacterium]